MTVEFSGRPESRDRLPAVFDGIEAVCFDAFGTLIDIARKQQAFRPLLRELSPEKRLELKRRLLREDRAVEDWPTALGAVVHSATMRIVGERVAIEVGSVVLRENMGRIWSRLRAEGMPLALCSNLASPYVASVRRCLPDPADVEVLSCEVGVIKPETAIYALVLAGLRLDPSKVLFVGDTPRVDIAGPRKAGMTTIHVNELTACMRPA